MTIRNPFLTRINNRDSGHHGRKAEESLARRLNGDLTPASGALAGAKGDIRKGNFLIESKATVKDSMILRRDWLLKIYKEALDVAKSPACAISFTSGDGKSEKRDRWVMVPEHIWHEIVGD